MEETNKNNTNIKNNKAQAQEGKTVTLTEAEYQKLKEEADKSKEYWDRILRLQADFENTRKRLEKDKQEFIKFANEGIILQLLTVLDDLERAIEHAQTQKEDLPVFLKGIEMILAHLYEMLKEHGVKPIEAEGRPFDPNFHEALMQVENKDLPEHTVVEELQKGYLLNDRMIRTAKVKVSKKSTGAPEHQSTS